jgi:hypothetical protein
MSLEGFRPISNDKLGSLVTRVKSESVPFFKSNLAQNVKFRANSVKTRNGLSSTMQMTELLGSGFSTLRCCGGGVLTKAGGFDAGGHPVNQTQIPLIVAANGANNTYELFKEEPCGTGTMVAVQNIGTSAFGNCYADFAFAFNKAFFTINDFNIGFGLASIEFLRYDGTGVPKFVGLPDITVGVPITVTGTSGGIVDAGTRWMVVLFESDSGYIGGNANLSGVEDVTLDGTQKIAVSGIPTGVVGAVTKRICCFTTAGATVDGPYYYIPEDIVIDGVTMTSTVINDGFTTTTATFNFTDQVLQGSEPVSSPIDFFDKISLFPSPCSVFFSPTNRRMIACGGRGNRTIFFVSEQDDPETYLGSTGFIDPNQNNGEFAVCAREFKSQLYLFKETAGFLAYNDAANPSDWTVEKRWDRVGPVGPWAVDVNEEFMIILDHSGVYHVDSSIPNCISDEISSNDAETWARINFNVQQKFWVFIDNNLNEIHVGVAVDGATEVNAILKCNYLNGIGANQRKWSIDYLPTTRMIEVKRTIPANVDPRIKSSQILHLSSNFDSSINLVDPASYNDNGNGINSVYQTGYYEEEGEMQIGGVGINASGQGNVIVSIVKGKDDETLLPRQLNLKDEQQGEVIKCRGTSPWFSLKFSNNNIAGNWFEITRCDLYVRTMFKTRRVRSG